MTVERLTAHQIVDQVDDLRRLARRLLTDADAAEDVVQDVVLVALERPPARAKTSVELRAWCRSVVRTLARQHVRSGRRRRRREERASQLVAIPSFVIELQRRERLAAVRNAIDRLPEPTRTAVCLRFDRGLAPREIARLQGEAPATIRMRLSRGIRSLKNLLVDRDGTKRWSIAFWAWVFRRQGTERRLAGVAGLSSLVFMSAVAASKPSAIVLDEPLAALPIATRTTIRTESSEVVERRVAERRVAGLSDSAELVRGRVFWADGRPAAGVSGHLSTPGEHPLRSPGFSTDTEGGFEVEAHLPDEGVCFVDAADEGLVTVRRGFADRARLLGDAVIIAARSIPIEGSIVDALGRPVAGAELTWCPPDDWAQRFGCELTFTRLVRFGASSDSCGAFRFDAFPQVVGSSLTIQVGSAREVVRDVVGEANVRVQWKSERRPPLHGRVYGPWGKPSAGVTVFCGDQRTTTDPSGRFELPTSSGDDVEVVAIQPGWEPARCRIDVGSRSSPVELRVENRRSLVSGRVVDPNGRGVAGLRVMARDLDFAYREGREIWSIEGLCCDPPRPTPIEPITDSDGRFQLDGLGLRSYEIAAIDPVTLVQTSAVLHPSQRTLRISWDGTRAWPRVEGAVIDRSGASVGPASVWLWRPTIRVIDGEDVVENQRLVRRVVRSDRHGRFDLETVPFDAWLQIESAETFPTRWRPAPHMTIPCDRRRAVLVDGAPERAHSVCFRDDLGDRLPVLSFDPFSFCTETRERDHRLSRGRSAVLTVPHQVDSFELLDEAGRILAKGRVPQASTPVQRLGIGGLGMTVMNRRQQLRSLETSQ